MKRFSLFLLALFCAAALQAYDFQAGDLYYNILADGTAEVTFQKQYSADNYSGLTDVTIPSSVTHDGTTYTVTSIGGSAFYKCSNLTNVTIPNSVTSIGYCAFYQCTNLTTITIGSNVTTIGEEAFYNCSKLISITFPNTMTSIGNNAFYNCKTITSITFPENMTTIGVKAFYRCSNLSTIAINGIPEIGTDAFLGTAWWMNKSDGVIYLGNILYKYKGTIPQGTVITVKEGTASFGNSAFSKQTGLQSIIIPNSVTSIGNLTFLDCTGLTSINLPNNLTCIGSNTFYGCTGLTQITIPENVTSIGDNAFGHCTNLTSITIPNSVTSIEDYAFSQCELIATVTIGEGLKYTKYNTFADCTNLTTVIYNAKRANSIQFPSSACTHLTSFIVGTDVDSIPSGLCSNMYHLTKVVWNAKQCSTYYYEYGDGSYSYDHPFESSANSITSFTFGNEVEYIPACLCFNMVKLTSITIPASVTSIGRNAFYGCGGLTSIVVEDGNTKYDCRENCNAIIETATNTLLRGCNTTTIPNSVTSIGKYAFKGCAGLTSVNIPENVTFIGTGAFEECTNITSIVWNAKKYNGCDAPFAASNQSITSFVFGNKVDSIPAYLCSGMKITSIDIPNNIKYIGNNAFEYCTEITSVNIPNSVISIGKYAFNGCAGLTSVNIPENVTFIGTGAFEECTNITSIVWNAKKCEFANKNDYCSPFYSIASNIMTFTFGDEVEDIPYGLCFGMSKLTSITIPRKIETISSFNGCSSLTSVVWNAQKYMSFRSNSPFLGLKDNITSFTFGNEVDSIPAYLCEDMINLTAINISKNVTYIGEYAFSDCSSITSVSIPENVTYIGGYAFSGCSSLTAVDIPENVTYIGEYSFSDCSNLTAINISKNVTYIGRYAFNDCSSLTAVSIPENVTHIGDKAFMGCSALTTVVWNAKKCGGWSYYYGWNSPFSSAQNITSFTFGNKVDSIPTYLCYNMKNLTSIDIPESVTSIGYNAFYGCSGITSIVIPQMVTEMKSNFDECTNLTSVVWNARKCGYSGNSPFYSVCRQIISFTFGNEVDSIPDQLCYDMKMLTTINIPKSVTSIGKQAFDGCSSLSSVTILPETPPTIGGNHVFYDPYSSLSMYIPCGTTKAYQSQWGYFTYIEPEPEYTIEVFSQDDNMGEAYVWQPNLCNNDTAIIYSQSNTGYHFTQWSDGNTTDWGRKVKVICDTTLTAQFAPNEYMIYVGVNDEQMGTIEDGTTADYLYAYYLDYITISATPNYGYHFAQWSDGNTDNPRTIQVTDHASYTAVFEKNIYNITAKPDIIIEGSVSAPQQAGYLDQVTLTASASTGYHFVQWSDGNTDNPRTVTITSDTTFIAEFATTQYTISAQADNDEHGRVQGATTAYYWDEVTLTAFPNYGYHFAQWHDGNTDNPRTIQQITEDASYTAMFDKNIYQITVQSMEDTQGSVSAPQQAEYLDFVTLTASANIGYQFARWNDGNTDNPRIIQLTCDTTFIAQFEQSFSGQCGDNLYWNYADDILTISGTGSMYDYNDDDMPWLLLRSTATNVVLPYGITHIGTNAFNGFVKLNKIELPATMTSIGTDAFAGCRKLYNIYTYAIEPPVADNTSFTNYNVYLYAPCDNLVDYQMDVVFGSFKYIQCMGAENTNTDGQVTVTPSDNEAVFVWPADNSAETYTLQITKDGEVFCTLIFNANGQLNSIAFAPSRNGQAHNVAEQTAAGFRFTVTGLTQATHYAFDITVKDANDTTLQAYTGEFNTTNRISTSIQSLVDSSAVRKIIRDGQVLILRDGKTYTTTGIEL